MRYRIDHWSRGHWTARPENDAWFIWAPTRRILLWRLPRAIRRHARLLEQQEHMEIPS